MKPTFTLYEEELAKLRASAGLLLAEARSAKGWSQRELARRVARESSSSIAEVESGKRAASEDLAKALAKVLEAPELEGVLLRAANPIPDAVLALLVREPETLAGLKARAGVRR